MNGCKGCILHDGWSRAGIHYIAVFACYMISKKIIGPDGNEKKIDVPKLSLLASSPMSQLPSEKEGNEEDYEENDEAVAFRSEELVNFLNCTLKYYRYDSVTEFATCQVADSVKSNIKAARIMNIPHLDCNNHTLNLQVRLMIKEDKPLAKMIENMHEVMVSIKGSLKNSALRRKVTQLRPVIENVTRWTYVFSMMIRT